VLRDPQRIDLRLRSGIRAELDRLNDRPLRGEIVSGRVRVVERIDDQTLTVDVHDVPVERLPRGRSVHLVNNEPTAVDD